MVRRQMRLENQIKGALWGGACGDALGLPYEFLRQKKLKKKLKFPLKPGFFCGYGFISDDTDHDFLTGQCLLYANNNNDKFIKRLAWCLRAWTLSLPPGVGKATLLAGLKLLLGFSPKRSGIFSAGNGPAMRITLIGARFYQDDNKLFEFVKSATEITHRDPKALAGSLAIAKMAQFILKEKPQAQPDYRHILERLKPLCDITESWQTILRQLENAFDKQLSLKDFAKSINCGEAVSGYIYHTVPIVIYTWYYHFADFEKSIEAIIALGGDTDTTASILGALQGLTVGYDKIPKSWCDHIIDWPRRHQHYHQLASQLALQIEDNKPKKPIRYLWPLMLVRNIFCMIFIIFYALFRQFF